MERRSRRVPTGRSRCCADEKGQNPSTASTTCWRGWERQGLSLAAADAGQGQPSWEASWMVFYNKTSYRRTQQLCSVIFIQMS